MSRTNRHPAVVVPPFEGAGHEPAPPGASARKASLATVTGGSEDGFVAYARPAASRKAGKADSRKIYRGYFRSLRHRSATTLIPMNNGHPAPAAITSFPFHRKYDNA